uniref:CTD40 n=1 Tax=Heliconius melpomene TaxID=34740 RepID=A0A2H4RMQ7_HELME|nr:CTD40 [Heliconius melpomene]
MMASNPEHMKCFEELKEWINRQPHLPKDLDDKLILRFAHSCYYDLEKAKTTVEMFFSIRGTCTDLLTNRDPQSAHMQKILKIINIGQISMSSNRCLWLYQINDPGLDNYDYISDAKLFFLTTDCRFIEAVDLPEEDIVLMDVKDLTLKFLTKLNLSAARKMAKYQENALPIRLKQVHVVNAPSFIDKIYAVMKPFITKQITELIHFHPPNSETLFQYIRKEDLPADYGGSRPPMAELRKDIDALISRNREKLIDENLWKNVAKNKNEASTEIGSFRTLAID